MHNQTAPILPRGEKELQIETIAKGNGDVVESTDIQQHGSSAAISPDSYDVFVRVNIYRILNIDLVAQSFTARLQVSAQWREKSLEGTECEVWLKEKKGGSMVEKDLSENMMDETRNNGQLVLTKEASEKALLLTKEASEKLKERKEPYKIQVGLSKDEERVDLFAPRLSFDNVIRGSGSDKPEEWYQVYSYNKNETWCRKTFEDTLCFQSIFDLHFFPYDHQQLRVRIVSRWPNEGKLGDRYKVVLKPCESKVLSIKTFLQQNAYHLRGEIKFRGGDEKNTHESESTSELTYPVLAAEFCVIRKISYWNFNFVFPVFCFVLVSILSFSIPVDDIADRLSVVVAMMLTTVAYKYTLADKLPEISYLTAVDYYVMSCQFLMMCQCLWIAAAGNDWVDIDNSISSLQVVKTWYSIILASHVLVAVFLWCYLKYDFWKRWEDKKKKIWGWPKCGCGMWCREICREDEKRYQDNIEKWKDNSSGRCR